MDTLDFPLWRFGDYDVRLIYPGHLYIELLLIDPQPKLRQIQNV
jgi:hypothetical protein